MKGRKIFAYLLILALTVTSVSGSGLENILAADKTVAGEEATSKKVADEDKTENEKVTSDEVNQSSEATENKDSEVSEVNDEAGAQEAAATQEVTSVESETDNWSILCSQTNWATIDSTSKTMFIKDPNALVLLSNCPAENYSDYTISMDSSYTGAIVTIASATTINGITYNFNGLGTKEHPFNGTFNIKAIKIPSALFCGLSSNAAFYQENGKESLKITTDKDSWKANSSVLAESYVFEDANTDTFKIEVSPDTDQIVKGSLIGEISGAEGILQPELSYTSGTQVSIARTQSSGDTDDNVGLICNNVSSGTLDTSNVTFPSSYTVSTKNGAAGGLIGEMQSGATLILGNATISADVTGTTAAGGIVGESNGATVDVNDSLNIGNENTTIIATDNAGGLIGKAENTTFIIADNKQITTKQGNVTASGKNGNAGGIFGFFSSQSKFAFDRKIIIDGTAAVTGVTAGGLVGVLVNNVLVNNSDDHKVSIQGTSKEDKYQVTSDIEGQNIGGLIGQYSQTNAQASLEISNVNVTSGIKAKENTTYGGLIGLVQNQKGASAYGYVKMDDADANVSVTENPDKVINYGGVIGTTGAEGYFLDLGNVTVNGGNTGLDATNCGGLVGNLDSGVLRLHGMTDLGSAKIKSEGTTKGQLVGARNNALIYALGDGNNANENTGWTLKRSEAVKVSDIGSYGEVYRQSNNLTLEGDEGLLAVDSTNHTVTVPKASTDISSAKDFATIAIRAQLKEKGAVKFEEGEFDFYTATLNLINDIALTKTGITGFMRDNGTSVENVTYSDGEGFQGSLNGNNHTITFSTGEAYGTRGSLGSTASGEGSGQIYRHKNTGLFAVTAGAVIQAVEIAGTVTVDSAESGSSYCGALVARNRGSSLEIKDCSTNVTITYAGNYVDNSKYYVGGLVGEITAGSADGGTLTMTGNTISGAIKLETSADTSVNDACMGGMISSISRSNDKNNDKRLISPESFKLDVSDTKVDGLELVSSATTSMGGLIGYDWSNVAVTWKNVAIQNNSSLSSNGKANFGGLVYKATGYWCVDTNEKNEPGIHIQSAAFTGNAETPDGLLVYSGRQSENSALYLEIKKGAYQIKSGAVNITEKNSTFDELVGVSMSGSSNGQGVVSLATTDASDSNHRFNLDNTCTTYNNVTKNNNNTVWDSNENTRYYYNLDMIRKNTPSDSGGIANEEQLLTWSVRRYAASNIKGYFGTYDGNGNESVQLTADKTYDLTGYSYYPVSVGSEENLTFNGNGATIKFDNESIDTKEETKKNTTTVMKTNTASQHRLMHFGLFLDFKASAPNEIKTYTLTVQNMKLTGNVGGILDSFSGALLCGSVAGAVTNTTINTHNLSVSSITLENLYVAGYQTKDSKFPYAPLLVNQIGSYTSVSLNNIKASYNKSENMPQYAASSLIGNAGSGNAQNISLSFSSIALQDGAKENEGTMFSRAMLLNSFQYPSGASCAATYNFNLADDWNNTYTHDNATYGKEISESKEYQDEEHWYYDTRKNNTNIYVNKEDSKKTGEAGSAPKFDSYKPYVYESYNADNGYHEIKVNVYVVDILNGCGTYGHPFQIDSAEEMVAIAEYMRTGNAGSGWKIRLSKEFLNGTETTIHNDNDGGQCREYTYNGTNWTSMNSADETERIDNNAVQEYMRNAYYQITKDILLDSTFCGFGYDNTKAFRGVMVGKDLGDGKYPTITLQNSSLTATYASHGLINNSYGSVVMNLNIKLAKGNSGTIDLKENTKDEAKVNNYYGSVMGQILGGDNFIDNVTVAFDDSVINLTGNYKHLIPVGGYVGIVQGGSLIFRNMESNGGSAYNGLSNTNIQVADKAYDLDSEKYFYINPYIGRVLDGCAFYEKAGSNRINILNNTDKNYQIATIDSNKKGITTTLDDNLQDLDVYPTPSNGKLLLMTTTVDDAQSLLILSAITNSGAAGGGMVNYTPVDGRGSYAYYGLKGNYFGNQSYGKSRNASYKYVGQQDQENDFTISAKDDHNLVSYSKKTITSDSNTPYLVTKYTDAGKLTYFYAGYLTRISLKFGGGDFDMATYQSGYRGIGGRYRSAAVQTGTNTYNADRNTPFTRNFNGNNKMLTLSMDVKEYCNDNYHTIGAGGVFNVLQQNIQDESKGIGNELSDIKISGKVQLSYDSVDGTVKEDSNLWTVGVGGLVGRSANRNSSDRGETYYADIKNVTLSDLNVSAPYNAGGIVGLGGIIPYAVSGLKHSNSEANCFAAHFTRCSMENAVNIYSNINAGGLFGWSASSVSSKDEQKQNGSNSVESCKAQNVHVQKNEQGNYADSAGVFFGKCDGSLTVDISEVKDSSVKGTYGGMLAGRIRFRTERTFGATDTNVFGTENEQNTKTSEIQAESYAGGLVGRSEVTSTIERCTVSGTTITANTEGGLLGEVTQPSDIYGCKVSGGDFKKTSDSTNSLAGALIGKLSADLTGGNLLWDTNTYEDGIATKGTWIGSSEKTLATALANSSILSGKISEDFADENLLGDTTSLNNNKAASLDGANRYKVQLAGVSRKDTTKSTSLNDVGSGEYDGYISYADYTVKNESVTQPDSSVHNSYPEAKFGENHSLTLAVGEFIYLGKGTWTIETGSESYVQIDDTNLLTAKAVGIATIKHGDDTYTINVADSFVETRTLLQNGTYTSDRKIQYNGTTLTGWSIINGYLPSTGGMGTASDRVSSILKIPMDEGYTYKIIYGEKDVNGKYPWGRMRLRVGESESSITNDTSSKNGWMSMHDKDYNQTRAAYTPFEENKVEIKGRKNQYIFLNYDNYSDFDEKKGILGYRFDTDGDRELFASITVTATGTTSERSGYDSLKLISMAKSTFVNGETINKGDMTFALCDSSTGIMRSVDSNAVTFDTNKVTSKTTMITATYNGLTCEIPITVAPYGENDPVKVVYSPVGQYQDGTAPFSGDFGTLYGDAVYNYDSSGSVKNNVDLICQEKTENKVEDNSGRVLYTTTGVGTFDTSQKMSTYKTEQKKIEQTRSADFNSDFRVLLVSGSSAKNDIEQYLDLLTNGGYSKAVSNASVTAKSETYQWDGSTFKDTGTSSLVVSNSGNAGLSYAMGKNYDNGKDQFTLLTVTLSSGTHTQVVYVPIIVRRIVEINFKATLNEESIFRDKAYDNLTEHVLVEYGSNMTGYLSWSYNKSGTEKTEYDWQSYMDSGADLTKGFEKTIKFDCSDGYLPAGTRITLIDTQNQDHVYYYTVPEDGTKEIALSAFEDASGIAYTDTAISELYEASATGDKDGRFVEADSADTATVAIATSDGTKYYRLKGEEDKEEQTFRITLNNSKEVTENYYMVVNVPEESAKKSNILSINGTVNSDVTLSVPCSITKVHRTNKKEDDGNSTESTFSILSSYTQNLLDQSQDGVLQMNDTNRSVNISLLDTITFDSNQAYGPEDKLYQDFMITPYNNEQAMMFLQDAGTSGTVSFQVYTKDNAGTHYYTYNNSNGKLEQATTDPVPCASYEWTSQEGKMNLVLGTSNSKDAAIDLSQVRTNIINAKTELKIYVQLTMSLTLSDNSYNELVPASSLDNDQPKNSLRLDSVSRLAKSANNLSESTWRGSCSGASRYYKTEAGCLNLDFEGDDIRQLGINLSDLSNNKPQVIDTTASIDFNQWSGWKSAMEETEKITFEFQLKQKQDDGEYKNISTGDYLAYMKIGVWDQNDYKYNTVNDDTWSFTQSKENGEFANLKDGMFSLPVEYAVKVSADQNGFQYANYRLYVKVSMHDKKGNIVKIPDNPDNPGSHVESLSDYVTYTVARVLKSF